MKTLKIENYGPLTQELLNKASADGRPKSLGFTPAGEEIRTLLQGLTDQNISKQRRVRMPHDAEALKAGLWLLFDFFEESHAIAQNLGTPSGSYWHAILHRREPDASNAKYWLARCNEHPILPDLLNDAREIAATSNDKRLLTQLEAMSVWDGEWFTDRCVAGGDAQTVQTLLDIQRREWHLLFNYNFSKAFA
jgi:hypothetical protein